MGDKATRGCREARDLNSIFPQLNNVSNGAGAHTLAREVEVVSPKGAVPVRVSLADVLNVSGERARGHGWEREEEESGLVRVVSKEVRGQKRVVEEGVIYQWWLDWWWWVDEDFCNMFLDSYTPKNDKLGRPHSCLDLLQSAVQAVSKSQSPCS